MGAPRLDATPDLDGLRKLLARDYDINGTFEDLKRSIQRQGQERRRQRLEEERAKNHEDSTTLSRTITVPTKVTDGAELDALIQALQENKAQCSRYAEFTIRIMVKNDAE